MAERYRLFTRWLLADLETPLSVYAKLVRGPYGFLLESASSGRRSRFSFVGLPAQKRYRLSATEVWCESEHGRELVHSGSVLAWLKTKMQAMQLAHQDSPLRFSGGLVGYLAYDWVSQLEPSLGFALEPQTELGHLLETTELAVLDNLNGQLGLLVWAPEGHQAQAQRRLDQLTAALSEPMPSSLGATSVVGVPVAVALEQHPQWQLSTTGEQFRAGVERLQQHICAGDIFQAVLSVRASRRLSAPPLALYRQLRAINPSPYMFYVDLGDQQLVGASPETLVQVEAGQISIRPIAGTRPRGDTPQADALLAEQLVADPKERAEHFMLLDLARNDVGRVSTQLEVSEHMQVELFSHVMHLVSTVKGSLAEGLSAVDALGAAFPAGTLSGAPKVQAMRLIEQLEPVRREVYGGAVGYLGHNGNLDMAIAIRTAWIRHGVVHAQAGAGIVLDSSPEAEWQEVLAKLAGVIKAIELAEADSDEDKK